MTENQNLVVSMKEIVKKFPGVLANDKANFELRAGEIHGLLGENGAGKSTLMNVLYGFYHPDDGTIEVFGRKVEFHSPADAIKIGIGMVHQHLRLVGDMTVTENVVLGLKSPKGFMLDLPPAAKKISELGERYGLSVDPRAQIWQLSIGEKQRVEILKSLYRNARILILDEPTSVLAPSQVTGFFAALRSLKQSGIAVVLITHKLDEVMDITDRVTVLRKGRNVATEVTNAVDQKKLAHLMIGENIPPMTEKSHIASKEPILQVRHLHVYDDRGLEAVRDLSFELGKGEILGLAGVSGNGQRELVETVVGLRKPVSGSIAVDRKEIAGRSPREIISLGVAYVPENRVEDGCVPDFGIDENLILKDFDKPPICNTLGHRVSTLMNHKAIEARAERAIDNFGIKTTGPTAKARSLSGGNLQRLVLARELTGEPQLIVISQPTRGLDVLATEYVRGLIVQQRNRGAGVLVVDEDLAELVAISDRLAVIFKGEIVGVLEPDRFNVEDIGLMMTGAKRLTQEA
jgi:general nucleoside transport system ATP-binding protein